MPAAGQGVLRMLKKLLIVVVIAAVLLVGGVVFIFSQLGAITGRLIAAVGTYALEVPVAVDSAEIKLGEGSLTVSGLTVANPEGFGEADERFLGLGTARTVLNTDTFGQEVVRISSITLSDLDLLLVKDSGGANYRRILESLKRFERDGGEGGEAPPAAPPGGEAEAASQRVVIDEVVVSNVDVTVRYDAGLGGGAAKLMTLEVPIDEIRLEGIGEDPDNPVDIADTISVLIKAVLGAVLEKAGGVLPQDLTKDLESGLAELASLGSMGVDMAAELGEDARRQLEEVGRQVEQQMGELGGEVDRALEGASKDVGEAAGRIGEDLKRGLGGLLPGGGDGG